MKIVGIINNNNKNKKYNNPHIKNIKILYWNAESISGKFDQLKYFISANQAKDKLVHIIAISEARLADKQVPPVLQTTAGVYTPHFFQSPVDKSRREGDIYSSGGLLVYTHHTIQNIVFNPENQLSNTAKNISPTQLQSTDVVWGDIEFSGNTLRIGIAYFHPQAVDVVYQALAENVKFNIENHRGPLLLGGDFNLKHSSWSAHTGINPEKGTRGNMAEKFDEFIDENDLVLLNSIYAPDVPTLFPHNLNFKPSTVDLVLTNQVNISTGLVVLEDSGLVSDHRPLLVSIINQSSQQKTNQEIQNRKSWKWKSLKATEETWKEYVDNLEPALSTWELVYEQQLDKQSLAEYSTLPSGKQSVQDLIDQAWAELQMAVVESALGAIGKQSIRGGYKPGFDKYSREIIQLVKGIKENIERTKRYIKRCKEKQQPRQEKIVKLLKQEYRKAVRDYKDKLKLIQSQQWNEKLAAVYNDDMSAFEATSVQKRLSWALYKRTVPSATVYPTNIMNSKAVAPSNIEVSNENLAEYYASVCSNNQSRIDNRDPEIVTAVNNCIAEINNQWQSLVGKDNKNDENISEKNFQWAHRKITPDSDKKNKKSEEEKEINGMDSESLFSYKELCSAIGFLNCRKAYGPDDVDNSMIKNGGKLFHSCLLTLFNACWRTGTLPLDWTKANVFPLYKGKGDKASAASFRPISLTSCLMRLFERIIHRRVVKIVNIHPSQAGFRKQHSTEDNLYRLLERVYGAMWSSTNRNGICLPVVFLDLQKAFDKMDINSALYKLVNKGLETSSRMIQFFKAFLSNRYLRTVTLKSTSSWRSIDTGTPQGSVLGPFLFLVYIDDLISQIEHSVDVRSITMQSKCEAPGFADDIYLIPRSLTQPVNGSIGDMEASTLLHNKLDDLEEALKICGNWARNWCMTFSSDKTNIMIFRKHSKLLGSSKADLEVIKRATGIRMIQSKDSSSPINFTIPLVEQYQYMGIILSSNCSQLMRLHMEKVVKTIRTRGYQVRRVLKSTIPIRIAHMLAKAMVYSVYQYGLAFIRFNTETSVNNYLRTLKIVWRHILHVPSFTNTKDMMMELSIPSLQTQQQYYLMKFVARTMKKSNSPHVKSLWQKNTKSAQFIAANGNNNKSDTRPYNLRPIALEFRELLGRFSSAQLTHKINRKWINPVSSNSRELLKYCMRLGFIDCVYGRNPNKGLAQIVLEEEDVVKINKKKELDEIQLKKNISMRKTAVRGSKRSARSLKPQALPNQNILTKDGSASTSIMIDENSYMKQPVHFDYFKDNPIVNRQIEQVRLGVVPTYMTIKERCYTKEIREQIPSGSLSCRKCKRSPETVEHVFLQCEGHSKELSELKENVNNGFAFDLEDIKDKNKMKLIAKLRRNPLPINMKTITGQLPRDFPSSESVIQQYMEWVGDYIQSVFNTHPLPLIKQGFKAYLNYKPP
jgi:endonuclease/exonuclease/phosphatase family metal-dependent hydrolase